MFLKKIKANEVMDNAGLLLLGLVSLGYVLFSRPFAKLHINLPVINTPIFIGEILFILCVMLTIPKLKILIKKTNHLLLPLAAYLFFIAVKTSVGYFHWGQLAFRHAALFYYPLFALFSYSFFRKDFFNDRLNTLLIILFLFIFKFVTFYYYFILTCSILVLILIRSYSDRKIRFLGYSIFLLTFPYRFFFETARTFMVSNLISLLFILICLLFIFELKKKDKLVISLLFITFIAFGVIRIANKDHLKSLISIGELEKRYKARKMLTAELGNNFVTKEYKINLYNPAYEERTGANLKFIKIQAFIDQIASPKNGKKNQESTTSLSEASEPEASKSEEAHVNNAEQPATVQNPPPLTNTPELTRVPEKRDLETDYANSLFRIFIWQDALSDIMNYKPVFGFDFGRPFLSRSLEVTNWAISDWGRDGWVCFHNGYLDIIYRSGLLSIIFFTFVITALLIMIRRSFRIRSINGILLIGALINWFIAANFLEILEMPYTAIPLWSLFGLTCAYLFKNKTS